MLLDLEADRVEDEARTRAAAANAASDIKARNIAIDDLKAKLRTAEDIASRATFTIASIRRHATEVLAHSNHPSEIYIALRNIRDDGGGETRNEKPWSTLAALDAGTVFETLAGVRAVKSEYRYPNGEPLCVLLASGEYAHFDEPDADVVARPVDHVDEPRGPSEIERKVDEALTRLLEHARLEREQPFHAKLRDRLESCPSGTECPACVRALAAFDNDAAEPNDCAKANALDLIKISELLRETGYGEEKWPGFDRIARVRQACADFSQMGDRWDEVNNAKNFAVENLKAARDERNDALRRIDEAKSIERSFLIIFLSTVEIPGLLETTAAVLRDVARRINLGEHRPDETRISGSICL